MTELEKLSVVEFVEEQLKLLEEAFSVVRNNALVYHRANCENPPGSLCEASFMLGFITCIDEELQKRLS